MPLDLKALGVTVGVDVAICGAALGLLTALRAVRPTRRFYAPRRYAPAPGASAEGGPGGPRPRPRPPRLRWWAWLWQLWRLPPERVLQLAGSDGAQYLNALKLGLHLSLILSVWCLAVILPVNMAGSEVDRLIASQQQRQQQRPTPPPPLQPPPAHPAAAAAAAGLKPGSTPGAHDPPAPPSSPAPPLPSEEPPPAAASHVPTPAEAAADAAVAAARATADAAVAAAARFHSSAANASAANATAPGEGGRSAAAATPPQPPPPAAAQPQPPAASPVSPEPPATATAAPEAAAAAEGEKQKETKAHIPTPAEAAADAAREALNVAAEEAVAVAAEGGHGGGEAAGSSGGEAAGASTFAADEPPLADGGTGGAGAGEGGGGKGRNTTSSSNRGGGGGTYVFSDLDRLSLANIGPGSPLLWAHLVSVYVVTAITLRVLWLQSKEAVALRVRHVTHSPPGTPCSYETSRASLSYGTQLNQARRVLATATLFCFLPSRLRSRLEAAAEGLLGGTRHGLEAAAQTAGRYLDRVDAALADPSSNGAAAAHSPAAAATAAAPEPQVLQPAALPPGGHGVATLYAGRVRNVLPVLLAPWPSPAVAVAPPTAEGDRPRGGGKSDGRAGGVGPPAGAAATAAVAAVTPPAVHGGAAAAGAAAPASPRLPAPPPASPSPPPSSSPSPSTSSTASSTALLLRRRRRSQQQEGSGHGDRGRTHAGGTGTGIGAAATGGGGGRGADGGVGSGGGVDGGGAPALPPSAWSRAEAALAVMTPPEYVVWELGHVFPPCRPVALAHLRDERRLQPAVDAYGGVRRSLEDLLDNYERKLAAAAAAASTASTAASTAAGGGGGGWWWSRWRRRRSAVQRRKVRVLGPLLGSWAADLYGVRPVRVDELLHLRTHLEVLYEQVRQGLDERRHDLPYVPTAFVTFSRRWEAAVVSSALWDRDEAVWRAAPAPEPGEVLWGNLRLRLWQLRYREGVLRLVFGALLLTYALPISALQGLLQVRRLEKVVLFRSLVRVPVLRSLLSGLLPGAVLRLLLLLLPAALGRLVRWAGAPSRSQVDFRATTLAFGFQVVAVFLASFVAGALLNQIGRFVAAPGAVLTVLGTGAPQTASFFLSYILFTGLVVGPLAALRLWGLLLFAARYGLARTRRARARLLEAPAAPFAATTPSHSMALLLALVFSCVNPLVLPAAAAHFALAGLLERHAHCYVWAREYESGGRMWSQVFGQVMTGVYLHQAVMIALLSIKQFPWAPLALGAPLAAAAFHRAVTRMYRRPWNSTSLRDAADLDAADRQQQHHPQQQQQQQTLLPLLLPPGEQLPTAQSQARAPPQSPGGAKPLSLQGPREPPALAQHTHHPGGRQDPRHHHARERPRHHHQGRRHQATPANAPITSPLAPPPLAPPLALQLIPAAAADGGAPPPHATAAASLSVPQAEVVPETVASMRRAGGGDDDGDDDSGSTSSGSSSRSSRGGSVARLPGAQRVRESAPAGPQAAASWTGGDSGPHQDGRSPGGGGGTGGDLPPAPPAPPPGGLMASLYLSPARQLVSGPGAAAHRRLVAEANAMDRRLQAAAALAPQPCPSASPPGAPFDTASGSSSGGDTEPEDSDVEGGDEDAEQGRGQAVRDSGALGAARLLATSLRREVHVGAEASVTRAFSAEEVQHFVQLTGDANPIHASDAAAKAAGFSAPVLPGILVASLFPAIIGSQFPGTVYASQTLRFRSPALVGERVTATVTVRKVSGRRVAFETCAVLQRSGAVVVDGEALALMPQQQ
ncbi:hypothetical protein HXX76_009959 [Chlamydomonas incerta]|uniref:MaoC-like domain-containing protein n=1 Tax=Chlamydomonas incerta TaxID=51695 RepID=A0A835VWG7_CHLIN|nr:hypothetical protein HXX76_009959 [Chlamydomonas incerta]|eukprot:KAG2430435.1 hypothetical protein HXX76_009959 [Chlamydomonas incerta]